MNHFRAKNVLESFKFALQGIFYNYQTERNYRVHILFVFIVIYAGIFFDVNKTEWCLLMLCFSSVLATEMVNTSIETLTDNFVGETYSELAKIIKDSAAGAVLITAICTAAVGLIIFTPKLMAYLAEGGFFGT